MHFSWLCKIIALFLGFVIWRVQRCEEVRLSPFFGVTSACDEPCLQDRVHGEGASCMTQVFFPSWWNRNMIRQVRINQISSSVTLGMARTWGGGRGCCSSLRNTEIWVCWFLCVKIPATENLRRFEHLRVRSHVVALETMNSNELLRQFLDHVLDVARVLSIFSRFSLQVNNFRHYRKQE